ncbi:short chain dehydrogenase reductase [Macrophomina phaseolina]|uniref:Short chain dehydrogenase reductase n=1 Tax=Macrophomina phaseolina TaxID=35725 RepID=A0ABQ8GK16_9PEZI|nr:short chain dehydrogenase reductase [Macrophomina phaseolina]
MSNSHRVPRSLAGKVAIVTGAGSAGSGIGNGRAAAILLAEDGCAVLCVDRDAAAAAATVDMIRADRSSSRPSLGTQAAACAADVSVPAECERVVRTAVETFGRLDILVNNVGILGAGGDATAVEPEGWEHGMRVNVGSMVWMAKHAIPAMLRNDRAEGGGLRGSVVNIGSVAGLGGGIGDLLYPVSKGAVVNLTQSMAFQHGKDGIRVNCVCPGAVWTPLISENPLANENTRKARGKLNLLGVEGTGWDTGYAVRWLAGPESRWITGVILPVDGGLSSTLPSHLPGTE